jgi:hypothetical protein
MKITAQNKTDNDDGKGRQCKNTTSINLPLQLNVNGAKRQH